MRIHLRAGKLLFIPILLLALIFSCEGSNMDEDNTMPPIVIEKITPSNLTMEITIVGMDAENPNGDGSGLVQITATADEAIRYKIKFGSEMEMESTDGTAAYTFEQEGLNNYVVTVLAYSVTGDAINIFQSISVHVDEYQPQLIWSDEFDIDGEVSKANWVFETFAPDNGSWWNGEKQHYTDRKENAFISEGTLKIVAKKESYTTQGTTKNYTSARMTSIFKFTYGRVDVRAKLPKGEGTWPAIWTLGSNINTVGWPACGEIDIMEHWGHEPGRISSATHTTACSGGCSNVSVGHKMVDDYDTEFHVYSLEWTEDELRFLLDDNILYRYKPNSKNNDNWPYTEDQFLILNIAMGGEWFSIDPDFIEATMEVDYVRVYQ